MRIAWLFILVISAACLGGCMFRSPVVPPTGGAFSQYEVPVDIQYNNTTIGDKTGEAKSTCVLGLFSFGDCSVAEAARDGRLEQVDHIGCEYFTVLGIISSYKTIAYGK